MRLYSKPFLLHPCWYPPKLRHPELAYSLAIHYALHHLEVAWQRSELRGSIDRFEVVFHRGFWETCPGRMKEITNIVQCGTIEVSYPEETCSFREVMVRAVNDHYEERSVMYVHALSVATCFGPLGDLDPAPYIAAEWVS